MDPKNNPFAPSAGTRPPELAGREHLLEKAGIAVARLQNGLSAKSLMLVGLRGVGKTVLLNAIREQALAMGALAPMVEAPEDRSLPSMLIPALRDALAQLDRIAAGGKAAGEWTARALRTLGSFAKTMKLSYKDIEFTLELGAEAGQADTGHMEHDLGDLLEAVGKAAKEKKTMLLLCMDELQYVRETELAALITAMHRCNQRQLPVMLAGAGLPQLVGQMGKAKSYAERLFEFPPIGALDQAAARQAIERPALARGLPFSAEALASVVEATQGYPFFLQEWGKHCWDAARQPPVSAEDFRLADKLARLELDASFFRVRFDRLTPQEKRYLRAMAEIGPGPHRSGEVAALMGKPVRALGPVRASLIKKGMIYAPGHGDTAFTVPLFDQFMKRVMPGME